MTKSMYVTPVAVVICLALATATFAGPKKLNSKRNPKPPRTAATSGQEKVTLEITGVDGAEAAASLNKALESNGLSVKVHESKKGNKPPKVVAQAEKSADLSPWGKIVTSAGTAKKGQSPPGVELVIYAPLTKENAQQAVAQLEKVKGVDARHSTADVKKGQLRVRISGAERVTAEEIANAVKSAGVAGHFEKTAKTKKI